MKQLFLITFLALFTTKAFGFAYDWRPGTDQMKTNLGNTANHGFYAERAFDTMFTYAAQELRKANQGQMADNLINEWNTSYKGILTGKKKDYVLKLDSKDVGDHSPLNLWIAEWYAAIEAVFGVDMMQKTHLRDIWVLNFSVPVVLNPQAAEDWCKQQLATFPNDTCRAEYLRHFGGTKWAGATPDPYATQVPHNGFSGVVTYWVIWGACEVATQGSGWFVICTPAATMGEYVMEKFFAKDLSNRIWDQRNP